jgi:hypothetical protein
MLVTEPQSMKRRLWVRVSHGVGQWDSKVGHFPATRDRYFQWMAVFEWFHGEAAWASGDIDLQKDAEFQAFLREMNIAFRDRQ